jgi:hypothetical protein
MRNQAKNGTKKTFAPSIIQYGFRRFNSLSRLAETVLVFSRRSGSGSEDAGMVSVDMVAIKFIDQGRWNI